MKSLSYREYSKSVHRPAGKRVPLNGTIEITHRCPLECAHCYNNLAMGDRPAQQDELTLAEHCRILDEVAEAGCVWLLFTGGEIFARPDFMEIYRHAKRRGFLITLFTNGTMLTPALVEELREWRPFAIEITLYGYTRETYEAVTGLPGSHERCMRGIKLLLDAGLPLKLKTVALTINKHEVARIREFAETDLGVGFKYDAMMNPRIDGSPSPLQVRLGPEEVVGLDVEDCRRKGEWQEFARTHQVAPLESDRLYHCGGGMGSFAIDPTGQLRLCLLSHQESFDLRTGSFREGWGTFLERVRKKRASRVTKCTHCHLKSMCGMCPATSELENGGDPETPVDFLCEAAHLRAHAHGLGVPAHGECEYCEGGSKYPALLASVERVLTGLPPPAPRRLPVLRSEGAGGCGSCGS